ncbi:MAG: DUF188 domain-containing protein [Oscillospiraceae bacterium]|nr:DUF188 domain-containing protein [Oscillospiraceae bacterium]
MHILIDGDGCPVVALTIRVAREFGAACTIFCDTSHVYDLRGAETVVCDQGADSVDYKLANRIAPGDLAITQDYGLAAMCLSRGAAAISQNGLRYADDNIGGLLEVRAFSGRVRRSGGRLKGPSKRTAMQDRAFEAALRRMLEEAYAGRNS